MDIVKIRPLQEEDYEGLKACMIHGRLQNHRSFRLDSMANAELQDP